MLLYVKTNAEWLGEAIDGVRHPLNIESLWSDSELALIGLQKYVPPVAPIRPRPPRDKLAEYLETAELREILVALTGKTLAEVEATWRAARKAVIS